MQRDYFAVPDEGLKRIYSALTVVNGKVAHAGFVRDEACAAAEKPPADWSAR